MAPPSTTDLLAFREARIRRLEYINLELAIRRAHIEVMLLTAELNGSRERWIKAASERPSPSRSSLSEPYLHHTTSPLVSLRSSPRPPLDYQHLPAGPQRSFTMDTMVSAGGG